MENFQHSVEDTSLRNDNKDADCTDQPSRIANLSVAEKMVICIDGHLLKGQGSIKKLVTLLREFRKRKTDIALGPVEFFYLFYIDDAHIMEMEWNMERVFHVNESEESEKQPFDLGVIFKTLAGKFDLPDPKIYDMKNPPPFVLHVALLFSRDKYVPKLCEPNYFFFFAKNPFFELDILYISANLQECKAEKIAKFLETVSANCNGYYFQMEQLKLPEIMNTLNVMLGHPCIRYPQNQAKFKIDIREHESSVY